MSQASIVLSNTSRTAYRAAHNAANEAMVTHQSGTSEPSPRYAYQFWADTTTGLLKIRNAANSAWITVGTLATTNLGLVPVSGATSIAMSGSATITNSTSDGSDTAYLLLNGGGGAGVSRGAQIQLYGNESAVEAGSVQITTGGGSIFMSDGIGLFYQNDGQLFFGDTSNASNSFGFTINQFAADDEIVSLKSSDIGHGLSDTETDTYAALDKANGSLGGLRINGYSEDGSANVGILLSAVANQDTTKSTSGIGIVEVRAFNHDGTATKATPGTDANLFVIRSATTSRFIFDQEGSFHADVGSTTFDKYDDVALLNAFDMEFQRRNGDPIRSEFNGWLREQRDILQREKIVNYYDEDGNRAFVNFSKLTMLLVGAVRQQAQEIAELKKPFWKRLLAITKNHKGG